MNGALEFLRSLGSARLAAMGAVALGLIGFFAFLMLRLTEPQLVPLFTDLTLNDSAEIVDELENRNIPFELSRNGSVVLVPREQVLRLRMSFAEAGMPAGGTVGYEIFDNQDTLGTTSFVQGINHLRALEGELARTIRAINRVELARVHLVLPERQLFTRDQEEPSASIVLRVRGMLEAGQINAIQHLVASAVEGLSPQRVSIVDEAGQLLASGVGENGEAFALTSMQERTVSYENRLREQVLGIVSSVVGRDRARVQVAAELDFNRITETSDVFDPEGRVIRSTQLREEVTSIEESEGNQQVTVGNELPNANAEDEGGAGSRENTTSTEELTNFEISRTTRTEVVEGGRVKRLSVAVLVDGIYTQDPNGNMVYAARSQEQLDQIAALIRSAIGFSEERGDQVQVTNLQFAEPIAPLPLVEDADVIFLGLTRADLFRLAELGVLVILALLVFLIVVRPLVRRIVTPDEATALANAGENAQIAQAGVDALPAPEGDEALSGEEALPSQQTDTEAMSRINFAQIQGQLQASTIEKVGELVDNNPDEAVTIIREWLAEAA